jgi:hypothetical protein
MSERARVFISCGQRKDADLETITAENLTLATPELEIAKKIFEELRNLGYDPYLALEQQTLQGVKEAIFEKLKSTEYFLFIDFKREGLFKYGTINFDSGESRGSLFSNQELAIAAFQDFEILAFQEEGVKGKDGLLGFIQANCKVFSDRRKLPELVMAEVREKWRSDWRNEIELERGGFVDANTPQGPSRFFHIRAGNKHKGRTALNCTGFVERIRNLQTGNAIIPESVEMKWKGVTKTDVHIISKSFRYLDAIVVSHATPNLATIGLNPYIVDYSGYTDYIISTPGDHEIDYVVFSDNFSPARGKFRLHIGTTLADVTFQKI